MESDFDPGEELQKEFDRAQGVPVYLDNGQHRFYVFHETYGIETARLFCQAKGETILDIKRKRNSIVVKVMRKEDSNV